MQGENLKEQNTRKTIINKFQSINFFFLKY